MTREWAAEAGEASTFVVRLARGARGGLTGLVERARTGEKTQVQRAEHPGRALSRMLEDAVPGRTEVGVPARPSSRGRLARPRYGDPPRSRRITNAACTHSPQEEAMR